MLTSKAWKCLQEVWHFVKLTSLASHQGNTATLRSSLHLVPPWWNPTPEIVESTRGQILTMHDFDALTIGFQRLMPMKPSEASQTLSTNTPTRNPGQLGCVAATPAPCPWRSQQRHGQLYRSQHDNKTKSCFKTPSQVYSLPFVAEKIFLIGKGIKRSKLHWIPNCFWTSWKFGVIFF